MTNRRWLNIAEYISLFGSGVGSVLSIVSQQMIYASAPLSFCLLLSLLNRRRLEQQADKNIVPTLDVLYERLSKEAMAIQALRRKVATLPTPEDLTTVREITVQRSEEVLAKLSAEIAILQSNVQNRSLVEAGQLQPLQENLKHLQTQYDQVWESLSQLSHQLESLPASERLQQMEIALHQLTDKLATVTTEQSHLRTQVQDLTPDLGLNAEWLEDQVKQLGSQPLSLGEPLEQAELQQQIETLAKQVESMAETMDHLALRQEVVSWRSEVEYLQVQQREMSQSVDSLNATIADLSHQVEGLNPQPDSMQPSHLKEMRQSLTQLAQRIAEIQNQLAAIPPAANFTTLRSDLRSEMESVIQARTTHLEQELLWVQQFTQALDQGQKRLQDQLDYRQPAVIPDIMPPQSHTYSNANGNGNGKGNGNQAATTAAKLTLDRSHSRELIEEALDSTQERLIIASSWLEEYGMDDGLLEKLQSLLSRNVRVDVGWIPPSYGTKGQISQLIQHQWDAEQGENNSGPTGWKSLEILRQVYPEQFHLKALGTYEKLLVCDHTFALIGRESLPVTHATAPESFMPHTSKENATNGHATHGRYGVEPPTTTLDTLEVALYTTELDTIQSLIHNFDHAGLDTQDAMAFCNRGAARAELGDYQGAIEDYTYGLQLNPNCETAYNNRGVAYYELANLPQSKMDFDQALQLNPNDESAYYNRSLVHFRLGDCEAALEDYNHVLRLNPQNDKAYHQRGVIRSKLGDKQGALADYNEAIRLNPHDDTMHFNRGSLYSALQAYPQAIADYSAAIRLNSQSAKAYNNRGFAYHKIGEQATAIADFNQALQLHPHFVNAYNNRGTVRSKLGDLEGAIADFTQALHLNSSFANAYNNRGTAKSRLKDFPGAIADFTQALQLNPNFANAYNNRGLARSDLGDKQGAISDLTQAAKLFAAQGNATHYQQLLKTITMLKQQPVQSVQL